MCGTPTSSANQSASTSTAPSSATPTGSTPACTSVSAPESDTPGADRPVRVAVLVSGRGSNLLSLLQAQAAGRFRRARIVLVVSNRPGVLALDRAEAFGIPSLVLPHGKAAGYASREDYDRALVRCLRHHQIDLVCLAGFMRILSPVMVDAFPGAILNIHPSLLPAFPGVDAEQQALDYGVRVAGCTVHVVDGGVDTGPIVVQRTVPVLPMDTAETLAARILEQQHEAYPEALSLVTERPYHLQGRRICFEAPDRSDRPDRQDMAAAPAAPTVPDGTISS